MTTMQPTVRNAARLIYKALHTNLSPINDSQYRELLDLYRAEPNFAADVQEIAVGMELDVLDFSERGLIVAPVSRDSRFAVRMNDIRADLKPEQKAGLVLAHVAIASVFYPTTDGLDDDNYVPPPASKGQFRDAIHALARRLKDTGESLQEVPAELAPGWEIICAMPIAVPSSQRASPNSVTGLIGLALNEMISGGLVCRDRDSSDDVSSTYTATHRLRVQLRELTLHQLFMLAQNETITAGTGG
jgi:hypothetical protein